MAEVTNVVTDADTYRLRSMNPVELAFLGRIAIRYGLQTESTLEQAVVQQQVRRLLPVFDKGQLAILLNGFIGFPVPSLPWMRLRADIELLVG